MGIMRSVGQFLQWQWSGYGSSHQNKTNLLVHMIAVPLFMVASASALCALVTRSLYTLFVSVLCFNASLIMQRHGHKLEPVQPEPFKNGFDFVCRIFAEQWITFPRFVLTGGWFKNISKADRETGQPTCSRIEDVPCDRYGTEKGRNPLKKT